MTYRVLLALFLATGVASAAVETTTIQGKVLDPSGSPATGGTIIAQLSASGSTDDSGTSQRVASRVEGTIGADGSVTLALVPNDAITPAGTYYELRIRVTGPERASWTEKWQVDTSPDPVDIGAVTQLEVAPGITVGNLVLYAATSPSGSCTSSEAPRIALDTSVICQCSSGTWACSAPGGGGSGDITDVFGCTTGDCTSITIGESETFDGGAIDGTTDPVVQLPRGTACSSVTAEGGICWDTDDDALYVGDGAAAVEIAKASALHDAITLTGSLDYLTLSGQAITRAAIDLATDTTGTLAVVSGGTGVTSRAASQVLFGEFLQDTELTYDATTDAVTLGGSFGDADTLTVGPTGLAFEGAVADANATVVGFVAPTGSRSINYPDASGEISLGTHSNAFRTWTTPSGTSPVADSATDEIEFFAGAGITITGDSTLDTVTIAATGGADTTCLDAGVDCLFAASASEGGAASSGDTATAFFPTGTLEDARLSTNVPLLDAVQTFSATQTFDAVTMTLALEDYVELDVTNDGTPEAIRALFDWDDDDTQELADVHSAVNSGAKHVTLMPGSVFTGTDTANSTAHIEVPSNVTLDCQGATLEQTDDDGTLNPDKAVISTADGATNVTITNCVVDGGWDGVDTSFVGTNARMGIRCEDCTDSRFTYNEVSNVWHTCIYAKKGDDVLVHGNIMEDCGAGSYSCFYGFTHEDEDFERLTVTSNTCNRSHSAGYNTRAFGGCASTGSRCDEDSDCCTSGTCSGTCPGGSCGTYETCDSNICTYSGHSCLADADCAVCRRTGAIREFVLTDNQCNDCGTDSDAPAIQLRAIVGGVVANNTITGGGGIGMVDANTFDAEDTCEDVLIANNTIRDVQIANPGINIGSYNENIRLVGNSVTGTATNPCAQYGMPCRNCKSTGESYQRCATTGLQLNPDGARRHFAHEVWNISDLLIADVDFADPSSGQSAGIFNTWSAGDCNGTVCTNDPAYDQRTCPSADTTGDNACGTELHGLVMHSVTVRGFTSIGVSFVGPLPGMNLRDFEVDGAYTQFRGTVSEATGTYWGLTNLQLGDWVIVDDSGGGTDCDWTAGTGSGTSKCICTSEPCTTVGNWDDINVSTVPAGIRFNSSTPYEANGVFDGIKVSNIERDAWTRQNYIKIDDNDVDNIDFRNITCDTDPLRTVDTTQTNVYCLWSEASNDGITVTSATCTDRWEAGSAHQCIQLDGTDSCAFDVRSEETQDGDDVTYIESWCTSDVVDVVTVGAPDLLPGGNVLYEVAADDCISFNSAVPELFRDNGDGSGTACNGTKDGTEAGL